MWDKRAQYIANHDGDNATMLEDWGRTFTGQTECRLANVWAPELKEFGGPEVKQYISDWFQRHAGSLKWPFVVWTHRMKTVDKEQMTFNRYVCTITTIDGLRSLNSDVMQFIIEKGYTGGIGSITRDAS